MQHTLTTVSSSVAPMEVCSKHHYTMQLLTSVADLGLMVYFSVHNNARMMGFRSRQTHLVQTELLPHEQSALILADSLYMEGRDLGTSLLKLACPVTSWKHGDYSMAVSIALSHILLRCLLNDVML